MAAELSGESEMPGRRSRGSDRYASDLPRGRMLSATFALVGERGYEGVSARSVSERAGVSNRTFYESFSDREDCFLAAFNHAVAGLELEVRAGWESELGWTARVRAALTALLQTLDREPAVRRLVFVEALAAGPRVLARRASVLESLAGVVDQGRSNAQAPAMLPPLVAEGVVGATFGVIHARLLELRSGPLVALLGPLMATIVLPYRGPAAAARELARPIPRTPVRRRDGDGLSRWSVGAVSPQELARPISQAGPRLWPADKSRFSGPAGQMSGSCADYRLTVRTQMALAAVGGRPGLNNREVSEIIGLSDQGQISRMMKRLQTQGLIENVQGHTRRQVRAWRLTGDGEAVIDAHRPLKRVQRTAGKGGKLATKSNRKGATFTQASPGTVERAPRDLQGRPRPLRMTVRTHEVLMAVATLSRGDLGPSNRELAQAAGVKDEGQISKLLRRLEDHGLLENTRNASPATGNAWRLTLRGEELLSASRTGRERSA